MNDTTKVPSLISMVNTAHSMVRSGSNKRIVTALLNKIVVGTRGNAISHRTAKNALRFYLSGKLMKSQAQLDATRRFVVRGKSMNTTQKEAQVWKTAHVLSAADDYAAWGKKKRDMLSELKRDRRALNSISKTAARSKGQVGQKKLLSNAHAIMKKWNNHTLYDDLGIKPQAIAALREANIQLTAARRVVQEGSLPAEKIPRYVSNMIGFGADSLFKIQKAVMRYSRAD